MTARIALIGCGRWGRHILRDLKTLDCHVSVLARSSSSIANATQAGADLVCGSLEQLCDRELDGAVVASSTSTHFEVIDAILSMRRGLPIYCEKPVAPSSAQVRQLLERQPEGIFVMDKWRYHHGILELSRIARSGEIGKLQELRTDRLGWGSPHTDLNPVWHLMPHDLAIALEILGALPSLRFSKIGRLDGKVTGALAVFEGEPQLVCHVSTHWPVRQRRVQLVCSEGVAVLNDGYADRIEIFSGPLHSGDIVPGSRVIQIDTAMPLLAELEAFARFARGEGAPPKSSLAEALTVVERIEDILGYEMRV